MVAPINKMTIRTKKSHTVHILCGLLVATVLSALIQPSGAQVVMEKLLCDAEASRNGRRLCTGYKNDEPCPHNADPGSTHMCASCYAAYRDMVGTRNGRRLSKKKSKRSKRSKSRRRTMGMAALSTILQALPCAAGEPLSCAALITPIVTTYFLYDYFSKKQEIEGLSNREDKEMMKVQENTCMAIASETLDPNTRLKIVQSCAQMSKENYSTFKGKSMTDAIYQLKKQVEELKVAAKNDPAAKKNNPAAKKEVEKLKADLKKKVPAMAVPDEQDSEKAKNKVYPNLPEKGHA